MTEAGLERRDHKPLRVAVGVFRLDLGNYDGTLPKTVSLDLAAADLPGFSDRRHASEASGKLRGLGFACHIKATGGNPNG